MKKYCIFLFALLLLSCSDDDDNNGSLPKAKPIELPARLAPKTAKDNSFAIDLFKKVYMASLINTECPTGNPGTNIFISPMSISMALSMTLNGAKGETREEIEKALHTSEFSADEINEYYKLLRNALLKLDPSTSLSIANSIWYKKDFQVEKDFLDVNKESFDAAIADVDFSSSSTLDLINKWCADNTKNKIPKILNEIPGSAVMYLINAVYFKGIWQTKFNKSNTADAPFYNASGTEQQVPMMKLEQKFNYYSDDIAAYLALPYGNDGFSMQLMLPHENKTIDDVINNLETESSSYTEHFSSTLVNVQLPRFKVECEYSLNENLKEMGMVSAFSGSADLSGIAEGIFISEVKHKTYISVDEEGTEAAAVTSVEVLENAHLDPPSTNFIVNRPFVFTICENSTGAILFMGVIEEL